MSTRSHNDWTDPRVEITVKAVDWNALLDIACKHLRVKRAAWGEQKSGGYNLGATRERLQSHCDRLRSEVATMQYIATHTGIPVPSIIHYNAELSGNVVRSPYLIMSKASGTPLSTVWDTMPTEKRDIVLQQVASILLELSSHRFDKIGALVKGTSREGKDTWHIKPLSLAKSPDDPRCARHVSRVTYSSGTDYWIAYANANLQEIARSDFGSELKMHDYAQVWFLRSLIPSLYDPSLDAAGFPIMPGDFHSQNIMIKEVDSKPRITAIIDWEFSTTACTSTFAQYPLFIVDHPMWEDNHPLKARNMRDQAAFDSFMHRAEQKRNPIGNLALSRAFSNCKGVYLFEQCITDPIMFSALYEQLFQHVFGEDEEFPVNYYWELMEHGMLKKETRQFQLEEKVFKEARSVLGRRIPEEGLTKSEFRELVKKYKSSFHREGRVLKWLDS